MKKTNQKISRKKFLEIWKNYDQFEMIDVSIWQEEFDNENKILNVKGHIKAFMKIINKNNNNDKLDYIIEQIGNINTKINNMETSFNSRMDNMEANFNSRMDNMETDFNSRFDKIEKEIKEIKMCPTIQKEILYNNKN